MPKFLAAGAAAAALIATSLALATQAPAALQSAHGGLSNVVQVALTVRDLPRAIAFYRDTLGLTFTFETNGMAFFQAGDMRLMIGLARQGSVPIGGAVVYFDAHDWAATEAALIRRGVRFTAPTEIVDREGGREHALREFADPDGNSLAIMGWRPQS
jgi:methylmalonyl-CoA/ethylmalonyl-CoA epimerase